ncbi:MAG: four helix bundle protein [Flavobacteriaceae bacterium]|nr:four helix bundle protein [Flavobacteriaceae bacterium]
MRDFKKYDIWKLSHELTLSIYKLTDSFPSAEKFGLISQIRRSSASIPTNISEGCGRDTDADFNRFLSIALSSATETEYLLILSKDLNHLKDNEFEKFDQRINTIKRKIYTLKQKLISL